MTILGPVISVREQQMSGLSSLSPGVMSYGFLGIKILVVVILAQILSNSSMVKNKK